MSAKAIVSGAVILALLGGWATPAAAQPPMPPVPTPAPAVAPPVASLPAPTPVMPTTPAVVATPAVGDALPPGTVGDPWIESTRPGCSRPSAGRGPIGPEWSLR